MEKALQENNNIACLFFRSATRFPHHVALIHNEKKISYTELKAEVNQTAELFLKKGIKKGDRVLLFVPMSIDLYRNVLALFTIGATAVFLDEWVNLTRLETCCRIAGCKAMIGISKARILRLFSPELRKIPISLSPSFKNTQHATQTQVPVNCTENETALITFTTGSTGTPKAAKRTHGFLRAQFNALEKKINPGAGDVDMTLLPIVLLINLASGATSVIADFSPKKPERFQPEKLTALIQLHQVNRITGSPYFLGELSRYIYQTDARVNSVLQIFTGGAPVFPSEAKILRSAFKEAQIEIVYGSTEAEPISSVSADKLIAQQNSQLKGLSVGTIYQDADVKIIPVTDAPIRCNCPDDIALKPGQIGEIIVAGPHVLTEYFNNPEALERNKIFTPDKVYHRTGDSGFLNESNELFLTGRCSSLFLHKGQLISPFLYENYLNQLQGINSGTVIKSKGDVFFVLELKPEILRSEIEEQISRMDLKPDHLFIIRKMPRDPRHHSKIDYEKLKLLLNER